LVLKKEKGGNTMNYIGQVTAFKTQNGLKVRLNPAFCVQYLEEEKIWPWNISIEAFDSLRSVLSNITAIILMFKHATPFYSGIIILIMYLYGYYVSQSYLEMALLNMVYGYFYMLYSQLEKFFIPYIVLIVISIITKEYYILLSFIVARVVGFVIVTTITIIRGKYYYKKNGIGLGDVEITAIKLIQLYSDKDITFNKWIKDYSRFMNKYEDVDF